MIKLTYEDWNDLDNLLIMVLDNLDIYAKVKDEVQMTDEMFEDLHTKVKANLEDLE